MALVSRTFRTFHIPELLESATGDLDPGKRHPTHKLLQQLIALRLIGEEAIQDAVLIAEPALTALSQAGMSRQSGTMDTIHTNPVG